MVKDECTLLVMSCDKYHSAWYPYFSLLQKYWSEHPERIVLSTETLTYSKSDLQIKCIHSNADATWSSRLKNCLETIKDDFIIFSLEDYFIQDIVKTDRIEECLQYMKDHQDVAVCRLFNNSDPEDQLQDEVIPDFFIADRNVGFRLETQFALWNRKILLSFIDESESPWEFEAKGSKRIVDTQYRFLWYRHPGGEACFNNFIVPYQMKLMAGYGISMGHWLWNNKKLFKANGLDVDMNDLGEYSMRQVKYILFKNNALYRNNGSLSQVVFRFLYRLIHKALRIMRIR